MGTLWNLWMPAHLFTCQLASFIGCWSNGLNYNIFWFCVFVYVCTYVASYQGTGLPPKPSLCFEVFVHITAEPVRSGFRRPFGQSVINLPARWWRRSIALKGPVSITRPNRFNTIFKIIGNKTPERFAKRISSPDT